jgi:ribosomal-protein-alanine N-acetyltransferase
LLDRNWADTKRYALSVSPEIRPARLADAALIARMSRNLIERGLTWRWTPQAVAPQIRDSETAVVVAWADDRMLGFAIMGFRFLRSEAHILLLAVDPAARRSGVGLALWRWLETIARRGGIARVELEVRAENSGGRAFYHALGFREVARLRGYYESREDALRMVADLRPRRRSRLAPKIVRPASVIVTRDRFGSRFPPNRYSKP